jgi:pyruvate/2-oxoglutarate dehydrogenase complex dihydrolipoamide acyltransferase (E2) component
MPTAKSPAKKDPTTAKVLAEMPGKSAAKKTPPKTAAKKPAPKPAPKTTDKPEPQSPAKAFDLLETAQKIAKATKLKNATAVITAASGREARIVYEERSLAFVSVNRKGIRIHTQMWTKPEDRQTVETVPAAARLVLKSERRSPKPPKK